MLKLFRKIFGCWHESANPEKFMEMVDLLKDYDEHTLVIKKKAELYPKEDKKKVISDIISAVISSKEGEFVSYVEDAMDSVTDGKFKFLKFRPQKRTKNSKKSKV